MDLKKREPGELRARQRYFVFVAIGVFLILLTRLWYLQVVKEQECRLLSENNRIRLRNIPAVRGMILDRNGRVLADNRPSFDVTVMPEDVNDVRVLVDTLSTFLQLPADDLEHKIRNGSRSPFQPVSIKRDISWDELSRLKANRLRLPGVEVGIKPVRTYPWGTAAAHLLGYVGEIDRDELKRGTGYQMGDFVGKCGVEWLYESYLREIDGGRQVEVDAFGRELRVLDEVTPIPGHNLYLTIDVNLQRCAETLLRRKSGAIVAMNPTNGEILALCSSPCFRPEQFANGISSADWEELVSHPLHPLQNKAMQGLYPPGSVFKIITAAAGLEEGVITPETTLSCSGIYYVGRKGHRCWREGGHGRLKVHRALTESCDVFFYQVGQQLGVNKLSTYAKGFGLGRLTEIDLLGEKRGTVPDPTWKRKVLGEKWYGGETVAMAIGQSYLLVTPLQMLCAVSAIANGGVIYKPLIAKRVEAVDKSVLMACRPRQIGVFPISRKTRDLIHTALVGVIHDDRGTGRAARIPGLEIAGKTGTAQVVRLKDDSRPKPEEMPYEFRDHAWFVAYAPAQAPEIAVAVMIEHGGHGGSAAAPLVREILKTYFLQGNSGNE